MTTIFDPFVLRNNPAMRGRMLAILEAALDAVRPDLAVRAQLHRSGSELWVAGAQIDLAACRRIFVLGAGKAGAPMTQAVEEVLGDRITGGLVVVKEGHGGPTRHVELVEAGHPVPTEAALAAGARVLSLAHAAEAGDLVLIVLSGGGSALLEATGVGLADLQALTAALLVWRHRGEIGTCASTTSGVSRAASSHVRLSRPPGHACPQNRQSLETLLPAD
ncbi:MAG: DUF4147 domain-containing protein [Caldilineaceae bacterium]